MLDPYSILGVSRDAEDTEIKKAYRTLSKKYHPDNNPGNVQAEERFKQIQAAYEQIMREKKGGSDYSPFGDGAGYQREQQGYDNVQQDLKSAAIYIQNGYFDQALNVLNGMSERNAQWYYYSAVANLNIGNNITALEHARQAVVLEPYNYNYQNLVNSIESGNTWYTDRTNEYNIRPGGTGNVCMKIVIANLVCNLCFGGGGLYCGSNGCFGPMIPF